MEACRSSFCFCLRHNNVWQPRGPRPCGIGVQPIQGVKHWEAGSRKLKKSCRARVRVDWIAPRQDMKPWANMTKFGKFEFQTRRLALEGVQWCAEASPHLELGSPHSPAGPQVHPMLWSPQSSRLFFSSCSFPCLGKSFDRLIVWSSCLTSLWINLCNCCWSFKTLHSIGTSHSGIRTRQIFSDANTRAIHKWPYFSASICNGNTASSRVWVSCSSCIFDCMMLSSCAWVWGFSSVSYWQHTKRHKHPFDTRRLIRAAQREHGYP